MTLLLAGISDDFTGGLELASMMARDGLRSRMLTARARDADLAGLDVAVIALKSRVAPAAKAVRDFNRAATLIAGNGGAIQKMCDHCLSVPSTETARIQECHIMIGQIICGYIEETIFPDYKR